MLLKNYLYLRLFYLTLFSFLLFKIWLILSLVLRDIFPRWVVETKLISIFNPVYWFLKRHEKKLYKEADVIGVQSKSNLNHFNNKSYGGSYKLEVLFNWKQIVPHKLEKWNLRDEINFIVTTGGTGLSDRDVTPQATLSVIEYQVTGIVDYVRLKSAEKNKKSIRF